MKWLLCLLRCRMCTNEMTWRKCKKRKKKNTMYVQNGCLSAAMANRLAFESPQLPATPLQFEWWWMDVWCSAKQYNRHFVVVRLSMEQKKANDRPTCIHAMHINRMCAKCTQTIRASCVNKRLNIIACAYSPQQQQQQQPCPPNDLISIREKRPNRISFGRSQQHKRNGVRFVLVERVY